MHHFSASIKFDPRNVKAIRHRANIFKLKNEYENALKDATKIMEINETDSNAITIYD